MGMEEHLPITLVTELELTPDELAKYRVLILPNVACLSNEQVNTIQDYVRQGGGLVATCETSLCDEVGHSRGDFALKELFGTSYGGRPKEPQGKRELDANFAIAINESYRSVRCEPEGIEMAPRTEGDATIYTVPPLAIHSAIVIER